MVPLPLLRPGQQETARPMDFTVNGVAGAVGITFPGTGAWTTWQTKTVRLQLVAGTNTIRVRATTADGGPNADKLTVSPTTDDTEPSAPQPAGPRLGLARSTVGRRVR
ncbi:hypothetical protein [Kribbella sp. NPDC050470]|uniref:hypothetical protein n=1 Tax=unclassified Kribbella TaxID=2644121 RepID=UPI0037A7B632